MMNRGPYRLHYGFTFCQFLYVKIGIFGKILPIHKTKNERLRLGAVYPRTGHG